MSQGTFSYTMIQWEALKTILVGGPKIYFFQGVSPGFWVKNDQIL